MLSQRSLSERWNLDGCEYQAVAYQEQQPSAVVGDPLEQSGPYD